MSELPAGAERADRLNFREEATLRETEHVGGRWLDSIVYGLLEDEWKRQMHR